MRNRGNGETRVTGLAWLLPAISLCLPHGPAPASAGVLAESDHAFWLTIETTPPGAAVFAVLETGEADEQPLGLTPCTLAVDLNWGSRWFKKRWELITALSPGGFCRPVLQPNGGYRLTARLVVRKDGWNPVPVNSSTAVLAYPGKDWSGKKQWPTKQTLKFVLEKTAADGATPPPATAGPRRVVLAGGEEGDGKVDTGRVTVFSRLPGAEVFVDDQSVGPAPVELLLRAGRHTIELRRPGHPPSGREIDLAPDASLSFEASFPR